MKHHRGIRLFLNMRLSGSFFFYMAHRQVNDLARAAVGQAVVEHLALAPHGNQARLPQRLELIGDRAGRHADGLGQVPGAQLAPVQRQQDLQPRIRTDDAEKLRQSGDVRLARHAVLNLLRDGQAGAA